MGLQDRSTNKDELLTKASSKILLTRKDLEKAGIQNIGRYLHLVDDEPKKKKKRKNNLWIR